jgi:hypothetical protein
MGIKLIISHRKDRIELHTEPKSQGLPDRIHQTLARHLASTLNFAPIEPCREPSSLKSQLIR